MICKEKHYYQSTYDKATLIVLDILRKKGIANNFDDVVREYNRISMQDIANHNKKVMKKSRILVKRKYI